MSQINSLSAKTLFTKKLLSFKLEIQQSFGFNSQAFSQHEQSTQSWASNAPLEPSNLTEWDITIVG